ncbi:DUF1793-domain-containing protein [Xylariaceae sp. FL0016]|nr:DUF1793-domain-containing protein [Xylariaceae sp. FL0016]
MKLDSAFWSVFTALAAVGLASASALTPQVLPLIVRNPYLSVWLHKARDMPWEHWPMFWTGSTLGFGIMASVPKSNTVYPLLGRPQDFLDRNKHRSSYNVSYPEYHGVTFDASTTNLTYTLAGSDVEIILSFLSPITPTSTMRQSLPASYLTCYVQGSTDISLFIDINGQWVSGDRENQIKWQFSHEKSGTRGQKAGLKRWSISRRTEQLLTEFEDHAEWGTIHFTAPADVSHQSGEIHDISRRFAAQGTLDNVVDDGYRGIYDKEPIFAFSKTFELSRKANASNSIAQDSALFTFSLTQDPVVQFASSRGLTLMRPLWASYFPTGVEDMLAYHYDDFQNAAALGQNYSDQLHKDAFASGSHDYRDIAALSARQVLGATQFSGTPENPILFLKEISSNGNFQTVDVIFPAFPFFLYTNPQWLVHLLEPLLEHQMSGQYPNDYSMHDLGTHFPNATGHPDGRDEYMPVEECGDMLIMGLALINALKDDATPAFTRTSIQDTRPLPQAVIQKIHSVDVYGMDLSWEEKGTTGEKVAKEWIQKSAKLWRGWTGYLERESLIPAYQLSTDDFAGELANQTNLALKGLIGIKAMSEIANLVGNTTDAKYLRKKADDYARKWQEFGFSRDKKFAKLAYHWYGSWTTLYNLFADALLCFHLPQSEGQSVGPSRFWGAEQIPIDGQGSTFLPDDIYQRQSDWYHNVIQGYGLPMDSRHLYTKSDWQFFAAAVASKKVRTEILQHVATWVNETVTDHPFTDLYETDGRGDYPPGLMFRARPVVGGHFAFLALERACGGKAMEGLSFLDKAEPKKIDIERAMRADEAFYVGVAGEL